ncbi:hypothetical protein HA402_002845 [Bradysia odoriphaga]|nr:hypothetical protein HA402_002845 [Bradysia odoriphaga]
MKSLSDMTSPLDQDTIDDVVNDWVDVTRIPTISGGHFVEDNDFVKISTNWSVLDFAKKENVSFQRHFSVLKSSLIWTEGQEVLVTDELLMATTESVPIDAKKICISSFGTRKAILVEKTDKSSAQKSQILEIWGDNTLLKSYDLSELDKHKNMYTTGFFGTTMVWDKSAKKLAYLAEKKVAKAKPFFSSNVKTVSDATTNSNDKKNDIKGEEYAFRQTWGEQLSDMYFSVIIVLDVESDKFELIELSENDSEFPVDIQWVGDTSIVGTSYAIPPWRLGLYACNNRPSRIFQVDVDGKNLKFLSAIDKAAFSPRVRPDSEYVIWQERAVDAPHNRSRDIMGISLKDPKIPEVIYQSSTEDIPIYADFPRCCWAPNGSLFFVISFKEGDTALFAISLHKGEAKLQTVVDQSPGIRALLWIGHNYLLVSRSSTLSTPFVELIKYGGGVQKRARITNSTFSVQGHDQFEIKKIYGKATVPSIYIGPKKTENQVVPLVVMPHGGPHAVTVDAFNNELSLILRQGFALLKVNYIGSLGSKKDETNDLLGKIGKLDVEGLSRNRSTNTEMYAMHRLRTNWSVWWVTRRFSSGTP